MTLITIALGVLVASGLGVGATLFFDLAAFLRMHESERWWFRTTRWAKRRMDLLVLFAFTGGLAAVLAIIAGVVALAATIA